MSALILHHSPHLAAGLFRAFHQPSAVVLRDVASHNKVSAAVFALVDWERQTETIALQIVVEVSYGVGIEHFAQRRLDALLPQLFNAVVVGAVICGTLQHNFLCGKLTIINSKRGVWMITPEYAGRKSITREEVTENIKVTKLKGKTEKEVDTILQDGDPSNDGIDTIEDSEPWRAELAETLHSMNPYAFERLAMLLLRECGFSQVTVTKKSSDGGIDGTGKLRINGIFSFNVAFQCKRYTGSVSAGDIRDFRGSLTTDIEKGVFITTGSFTKAAREEASNAGKQQIDLIDGEEFISKLIEYGLGVKERTIYEVDKDFFERV